MKQEFKAELLTNISVKEAARFIANDQYGMQPKYDGVRRAIDINGAGAVAFNKLGDPVPLSSELREQFASVTDIQVDGEQVGNILYLFDILRADGQDLSDWSYRDRWQVLESLAGYFSPSVIQVSPLVTGEAKQHAFEQAQREFAEGVVFKRLSAGYRPGRNGQHFKCKFVATATVRVAAKTAQEEREGKNSLALEMMNAAGNWVRVGHCSMNGKGVHPPVGGYVEVRYLYGVKSSKKLSLVQCVYLMTREDVTDDDCSTQQIKLRQRPGK